MLEACGWASGARLAAKPSGGGRKSGWDVGARSQVVATTARRAEAVWAARLGREDHVNGARGLLGWAGKEDWEQGPRGCGWEPDMRGLELEVGPGCLGMQQPCRLGEQKHLAEGQAGGMQCSQLTSFLWRWWLLVLPHCPPPASTSLGDLAHGLSGIIKTFRNPQVGARFGSAYTKKEKKKNPQVQSLIPRWMSLLTPREGQALPPGSPSARQWQSQVLGQSDGLGQAVTSHGAG